MHTHTHSNGSIQTMEPSSQIETSWRMPAVYNRIFRTRPESRKIKKRSSLPNPVPASTPTLAPAPTAEREPALALALALASPSSSLSASASAPALTSAPAPTSAYQFSPQATAARRGHDEGQSAQSAIPTHHAFQVRAVSSGSSPS